MAEKKTEPKRKLTLHRETLRNVENDDLQLLEGVVGGTSNICSRICEHSVNYCYTDDCPE
ncbi:MAG TPA: hypothetical protein VE153_10185 [Myxococcus sp.]|nr:hypothetical protein [Myxococcus sp.]